MGAIKEPVAKLYDTDFYAWAQEQAALLRRGQLEQADLANIIEEIESLGRSEKRELESRLAVLLMHLLKWEYDSFHRSRSWSLTIKEQRRQVELHLQDNPSLRPKVAEGIERAFGQARLAAERETGLSISRLPEACPYAADDVMREGWLPPSED